MYDQMYKYFDQIFSKYQCSFLLMMVEKWKGASDIGGLGGALLTDPSKAFNCIKYDFLAAMLMIIHVTHMTQIYTLP